MIFTGFLYSHTEIFENVTAVDLHLGDSVPAPSQMSLLQDAPPFLCRYTKQLMLLKARVSVGEAIALRWVSRARKDN